MVRICMLHRARIIVKQTFKAYERLQPLMPICLQLLK